MTDCNEETYVKEVALKEFTSIPSEDTKVFAYIQGTDAKLWVVRRNGLGLCAKLCSCDDSSFTRGYTSWLMVKGEHEEYMQWVRRYKSHLNSGLEDLVPFFDSQPRSSRIAQLFCTIIERIGITRLCDAKDKDYIIIRGKCGSRWYIVKLGKCIIHKHRSYNESACLSDSFRLIPSEKSELDFKACKYDLKSLEIYVKTYLEEENPICVGDALRYIGRARFGRVINKIYTELLGYKNQTAGPSIVPSYTTQTKWIVYRDGTDQLIKYVNSSMISISEYNTLCRGRIQV